MGYPDVFRSTPVGASSKLFLSSLFFGTGWFSLSFTFPLLAQDFGYSYTVIGALGFLSALPFPFVAYIYLRSGYRMLRYGNLLSLIVLAAISLIFYFFLHRYFLPLTILAGIFQAPWWIATEISLGSISGQKNAEKYSAGWGIPNAAAPLLMGILIQLNGYDLVFLVSFVSFLVASIFSPKPGRVIEETGKAPARSIFLLSPYFAGLYLGFLYFVLEPLLKANNFSYVFIGSVASLYAVVAAVGYVILNYVGDHRISTYSALSALFIFPTALIGISVSVYTVLPAITLAGFGVSIAMSKVLSYISRSSNIRKGVFFYETIFGIGFMSGSLVQGTLLEYLGRYTISLLFVAPLIYGIYSLTIGE